MSKDLEISVLFDFYAELLTENQRNMLDLYYNSDLSLAEIASDAGISRQGVQDNIRRARIQLEMFEGKLGLAKKFKCINTNLDKLEKRLLQITDEQEVFNIIEDIREYI